MKKENLGSVKALKKQLGAAVAMVCVAAVALGSSTYAWFVSNNKVTATTTNISAQSNSAYLVIDTVATNTKSTSSKTASGDDKALYPAKIEKSDGKALWKSAYASTAGASTMKEGTEFTIDDGTAEKAVSAGYAVKNTFYIGTGTYDGEFTNLHITGVTVDTATTTGDDGNKNLGNAMRVLVVCGSDWQVWSATGELLSSATATGTAFSAEVKKDTDATVDVYVYYDGDDTNVYSDNLANLTSNGVTITFEATPKEYKSAPTA